MAGSDLIVVWGGNPVSTQVNAMTHIAKARKQRGAKLAVVDVYRTPTVEAADIGLVLRPGTDGALALAMMHVLLKEGLADRAYLARYTDFGPDIEAHLADKTPQWASPSPGLSVARDHGLRAALWRHRSAASCASASASRARATARPACTP